MRDSPGPRFAGFLWRAGTVSAKQNGGCRSQPSPKPRATANEAFSEWSLLFGVIGHYFLGAKPTTGACAGAGPATPGPKPARLSECGSGEGRPPDAVSS